MGRQAWEASEAPFGRYVDSLTSVMAPAPDGAIEGQA